MGMESRRHRSVEGRAVHLASLLWPPTHPAGPGAAELLPEAAADLDLEPLVQALSAHAPHREAFVRKILTTLCTAPEIIIYRQRVISNLLEEPELRERLAGLIRTLSPLVRERLRPLFQADWTVSEIITRLGELELYVDAALGVSEALDTPAVRAPALRALQASIASLISTPEFERLRAELPGLRAQLDELKSVTIGVNLSSGLRPESATILSLNAERIEGRGGLLQRLLGRDAGQQGMTQLRGEPARGLAGFFPPMKGDGRGHENELVADLTRLLEQVVEPVGQVIDPFVSVHTGDFVVLESELAFFLNAAGLVEKLRGAGLPVCCPDIAPVDDRIACLEDGYNVCLALRTMSTADSGQGGGIVTSPIVFDAESGRVWVLTGPNRGGKTTYARAVGLAHLLFQAGLYVPAGSARMSPADALFTHFPGRESASPGKGRLDEEAERLAAIFHQATPHSLVLLNEALSGTSTLEALALARDALRGLRLLGVRAIYVTHLHELAAYAGEINQTTDGDGTVGSLVAEVDEKSENGRTGHRATFRIRVGPPLGLSYASEIAEAHGISFPQLQALLEGRR
jgi:hypothetical protein